MGEYLRTYRIRVYNIYIHVWYESIIFYVNCITSHFNIMVNNLKKLLRYCPVYFIELEWVISQCDPFQITDVKGTSSFCDLYILWRRVIRY